MLIFEGVWKITPGVKNGHQLDLVMFTWRIIPGLGYVVNNYGSMLSSRPLRIGLWDPFPMAFYGL